MHPALLLAMLLATLLAMLLATLLATLLAASALRKAAVLLQALPSMRPARSQRSLRSKSVVTMQIPSRKSCSSKHFPPGSPKRRASTIP
jgi:hypothetical protein